MMKIKARSPLREHFGIEYDIPGTGRRCTNNCGLSYKVSLTPNLKGFPDGNHVQFEYTSKDGILYYDISFVDCARNLGYLSGDALNCPGWRDSIHIDGQQGFGCRQMDCAAGSMCM